MVDRSLAYLLVEMAQAAEAVKIVLKEIGIHCTDAHPEVYSQLEARAAALCASPPARVTVNRVGSMFTFFFTGGPVTDWESAKQCDTARFGQFFRGMLERGIYLAPSQFEAAFVSAAHSDDDIRQTIAFASSGGLDSCTVTKWLTEHGVTVVCFTADIAQPDETDFGEIEKRMRACGAAARWRKPAAKGRRRGSFRPTTRAPASRRAC